MADYFGKLVVRSHAPKRRAVLLDAGRAARGRGIVLRRSNWAATMRDFAWSIRCAARCRRAARIRQLEAENENQRRQLEAAETARRVDREGYEQVERSLGDMQSQIARLNQDLSFYRGLVQPESLIHVKVQQMQIVPDGCAGQYHLKFVLMQTGKPDKEVAGNAAITLDGLLQGKPLSLNLRASLAQPRASAWHTHSSTFRNTTSP